MAIYMWRKYNPELCFTANTAGSTVALNKNGSPTTVTLETSTDGDIWTTYTFWNTITLSNIWDKVYFRNTSASDTGFSTSNTNYYNFVMSGSIAWSWNINYLLNKNWTSTLSNNYCFFWLFKDCTALKTPPELPATTLSTACYYQTFYWCTALATVPELPATTLADFCYMYMFANCTALVSLPKITATTFPSRCCESMFQWCSQIKLSTSQWWIYQTLYRVPFTWTGSWQSNSFASMFSSTWGSHTWTITINQNYYTSNQLI